MGMSRTAHHSGVGLGYAYMDEKGHALLFGLGFAGGKTTGKMGWSFEF
jgi:hypothetical protein